MASIDESPSEEYEKGYQHEWFTKESQKTIDQRGLVCFICELVLRAAVQVTCGARFCENCYHSLFIGPTDGPVSCPSCEHDNVEEPVHLTKDEYQPDNFCRNQIKRLQTHCENHALGCPWEGKVFEREHHIKDCTYGQEVTCACGEKFADVEKQQRHLEQGCPKTFGASTSTRPCPSCGHGQVQSAEHIEQICSLTQSMNTDLKKLSESSQPAELKAHSLPLPTPAQEVSTSPESSPSLGNSQYEALINKYKANTSLITVLFNEVKTCSQKLLSMDSSSANTVREDVESLKQRVTVLEAVTQGLQSKIPNIERLLQDVAVNSSGLLNWRIDNINQRMEEARNGTMTALYSQPFYKNEAGYKMCARLYLNGDGIGKDSHVSLFFVLMKGRYDAILSWPFSHPVTMKLLDQSGQGNHVQEKFRPDPNSSSFQRPRSDMNIATGCPRFISKVDLERRKSMYMKDHTVFIQIIVE